MAALELLSIGFVIIAFLGFILYKLILRRKVVLSDAVTVAIQAGMIPSALAIILFKFFPDFIGPIENMGLQITLIGLVLLFVNVKTIYEKVYSDSS